MMAKYQFMKDEQWFAVEESDTTMMSKVIMPAK